MGFAVNKSKQADTAEIILGHNIPLFNRLSRSQLGQVGTRKFNDSDLPNFFPGIWQTGRIRFIPYDGETIFLDIPADTDTANEKNINKSEHKKLFVISAMTKEVEKIKSDSADKDLFPVYGYLSKLGRLTVPIYCEVPLFVEIDSARSGIAARHGPNEFLAFAGLMDPSRQELHIPNGTHLARNFMPVHELDSSHPGVFFV